MPSPGRRIPWLQLNIPKQTDQWGLGSGDNERKERGYYGLSLAGLGLCNCLVVGVLPRWHTVC